MDSTSQCLSKAVRYQQLTAKRERQVGATCRHVEELGPSGGNCVLSAELDNGRSTTLVKRTYSLLRLINLDQTVNCRLSSERSPDRMKRSPGQASPSIPDFVSLDPGYAALKFNHRSARQRDVAGDADGAAFGEMERRVLLVIDGLARRAVDRNDDLVAALHRFL